MPESAPVRKDGWFELTKAEVDAMSIRGKASLGGMVNPRLEVDRRTGMATFGQFSGMYNGDRARKTTLVEYGFRLPSALDNRPLKFEEFEGKMRQCIFVSATPAEYARRGQTRMPGTGVLSVTVPGVVNGGFESSFTGWTRAGTTSISTSSAYRHSGSRGLVAGSVFS